MDSYDVEVISEYVRKIIDSRQEYDSFSNSEELRQTASELLVNYLLSNQDSIKSSDKYYLEKIINRWIDQDLFRIRSLSMQDRSKANCFKTRRKINIINSIWATILLGIVILGGSLFTIKGSLKKNSLSTSTPTEVVDTIDRWSLALERMNNNVTYNSSNDQQINEMINEVEANMPYNPYVKPRELTDEAKENYTALISKYDIYYSEYGSRYAQIPLYEICQQIFDEYRNDHFRTMDIVFEKLQDDLKRSTLYPGKHNEEDAKYELVAGYKTYIEYVYSMLKNVGYDVQEYDYIVQKYSSFDSPYLMENNGLDPSEVSKMDEMFTLYGEFINSLRKGVVRK